MKFSQKMYASVILVLNMIDLVKFYFVFIINKTTKKNVIFYSISWKNISKGETIQNKFSINHLTKLFKNLMLSGT